MALRKSDCVNWTLVLVLVLFSSIVHSRPQVDSSSTIISVISVDAEKTTESPIRTTNEPSSDKNNDQQTPTVSLNTPRDVKTKTPAIGESIKRVATQLLEKGNISESLPVIADTRIPPKLKTQIAQKLKIKTRNEDGGDYIENSHAGIAVPITMEELESENKNILSETATTNEGISTWILLSNPSSKETSMSTEPTKLDEVQKKQKPTSTKNKNKKPQNKTPLPKRPIIGSTNKSDLVASGSAINENVYNKIKDTVLSNVQKNKNGPTRKTTVSSTTKVPVKEVTTTTAPSLSKATVKPSKKINKNKPKPVTTSTTTFVPVISQTEILPMEAKEQEIELEISTPATTTKKPKRSSTRKKTKTKKRKTTKPKTESSTAVTTEVKTVDKTKAANKISKTSKKPNSQTSGPFTSQIYNYFSREVMPSVGVGVIGLAGILGIAGYFLYPFATPVRRTIEVDKKDDIYRHNAEEYGNEGNGQPEEEMLGTVLAGMPINSKQKLNPYAAQTAYINRYPTKKDQDIRYRKVATTYEHNHNVHYPQQKTGIAHGAVYPQGLNYNRYQYETRHAYMPEKKIDKGQTYSQYPAVEPIYATPQVETSDISSYGSDASSSVVYGIKPADETDFKPVYPYETQYQSETTHSPTTYPPTSMYLGSNNEGEQTNNDKYDDEINEDSGSIDNKFVVGNVPKELTESVTPVIVPEHGPRKLNRKRRNIRNKRSVVTSVEEILKAARQNKNNDIFISNEIDDGLEVPKRTPSPIESMEIKEETDTSTNKEIFTVFAVSVDPTKEFPQTEEPNTLKNDIIESVSTLPLDDKKEITTETEISNELEITTEENNSPKSDLTTHSKNMNTETTTEIRSEKISTMPPLLLPLMTSKRTLAPYKSEIVTYPPSSNTELGFFDILKRLGDLKYRLGLRLLELTSRSLIKHLRRMVQSDKTTNEPSSDKNNDQQTLTNSLNTPRDVKTKTPVIRESIKKVATQLLEKGNISESLPVIADTRIPPKLKTQIAQKLKIKTRNEDVGDYIENSHAGIAVPVTMEELESENKNIPSESATTNEGISTWILLSNPSSKETTELSTEPTKHDEVQKKQKPSSTKNKNKKPQNKTPLPKRPIIGSTNKSDLVASGSAINENVYNKIKDTVLSNVQKNKNGPTRKTTVNSTTVVPVTEVTTTTTPSLSKPPVKPSKKINKNKPKPVTTSTTTFVPVISQAELLPMEAKEQEIELEISTPATTTKKPKRSSTRKKTKTKKRKTTKPKTESSTAVTTEVKTANKTKSANKISKTSKKPNSQTSGPFTSQIYNYFSREVIPSVGVGVIGLAGILGIASYFLYPFATPVRRTIEVDKKDDIYRHNAEEYGNEGNGQPEEEMLGTVLAGMPINSKQKLNPYAAQTAYINRYPTKKDQDIRYRQVATTYEQNHNVHYPQQKTGIAHGAVYPEALNYNRYQYETRHAYMPEKKIDKGQTYSPFPAVEPIYAAPVETSDISSYGSDASSSVVYGIKPADDTDFKPVYPYETQYQSETTHSPITYPPTSMYLGSNNEADQTHNDKYDDEINEDSGSIDNKFVVGNVPKELTESVTPVVVPEHGPRKLNRKRRNIRNKRSVVTSIEEILKAARQNKDNDIFISNEIDDGLEVPKRTPSPIESMEIKEETDKSINKEKYTVFAVSVDPTKEFPQTEEPSTLKNDIIESVSTLPLDDKKEITTETEMSNELEVTTKENNSPKSDLTTHSKNMNTETTTEIRSETTSTMPPLLPPLMTSKRPGPSYGPEIITYPPPSNGLGFFDFLKRVVYFKYRLGLSLLKTTSESLNRYLRSMEQSVKRATDN